MPIQFSPVIAVGQRPLADSVRSFTSTLRRWAWRHPPSPSSTTSGYPACRSPRIPTPASPPSPTCSRTRRERSAAGHPSAPISSSAPGASSGPMPAAAWSTRRSRPNQAGTAGVQIFVNLGAENKLTLRRCSTSSRTRCPSGTATPATACASSPDRSRASPRRWSQSSRSPCSTPDCSARSRSIFRPPATLSSMLSGSVVARADGHSEKAGGGHALALRGSGRVTLEAAERAHLLVLSGAQIREPVVTEGPFIMNQPSQVEEAITRYRTGAMGQLAPLAGR